MKGVIFCLFLITHTFMCGQDYSGSTFTHNIESKVFGESREFDVYLPNTYIENPSDSFPVIYVFDAQFDQFFDVVAHTADYMMTSRLCPKFILVGIKTQRRAREFTPQPIHQDTRTSWGGNPIGEAHLLEDHLLTEVIPLVESEYRTHKFRMGIGHSLGGTFVTNSLLDRQEIFKAVISISPNLHYDEGQIVDKMEYFLKNGSNLPAFHFMTVGTVGKMEIAFEGAAIKMDSIFNLYPTQGLHWVFKKYEGMTHETTPLRSIYEGLMEFNKFWNISITQKREFLENTEKGFTKKLQEHFKQRSEWAGHTIIPNAGELQELGYFALENDSKSQALSVFNWAISLHPDNADLYSSKAKVLEEMDQLDKAGKYYQKALSTLHSQRAVYDEDTYTFYRDLFIEDLERIRMQ